MPAEHLLVTWLEEDGGFFCAMEGFTAGKAAEPHRCGSTLSCFKGQEMTWHRGKGCTADKVHILAKILVLIAAQLS